MSDQKRADSGLLGKSGLPRERPSVRSPRRLEAAERERQTARKSQASAARVKADARGLQRDPDVPIDTGPDTDSRSSGAEQLARAGAGLATGAAAAGLRLAGRTVGKVVGRR